MSGPWLATYLTLWIMVLGEGLVIAVLLRQLGILHLRIGPAGARTLSLGPDIGDHLRDRTVDGINGDSVVVFEKGRATLLMFVSPTCDACRRLLPAVRTLGRSERRKMDVVLVPVSGDLETNLRYAEEHGVADMKFVKDSGLARDLGVLSAPYAIIADDQSRVRAKGLVNHIEHLESLIEALNTGHPTLESYMKSKEGMRLA